MTELHCESEKISLVENKAITEWLVHGGANVAMTHVKSQIVRLSTQSINEIRDSDEHPNLKDSAAEALKKAARYETFLDVLVELQKETKFEKNTKVKHA